MDTDPNDLTQAAHGAAFRRGQHSELKLFTAITNGLREIESKYPGAGHICGRLIDEMIAITVDWHLPYAAPCSSANLQPPKNN